MSYLQILTNSGAATLADDAAFDLTGDAEWRFDLAADDWTPSATQYLCDRYIVSGNNRNWRVRLDTDSDLLHGIGDGSGAFRFEADQSWTQPADGVRAQIRLTVVADNAGSTDLHIYSRTGAAITDLESDVGWTLEDSNTGNPPAQTWKATTNHIRLGSSAEAIGSSFIGKFYRAVHWSDLTKTTKVFDVTFDDASRLSATTFNDAARTGAWTINGTQGTDWIYVPDAYDISHQWLSLPGSSGSNVRTPTTTALDVTNDLDIMVRLDADTSVGSADRPLIGRQQSASTFALVYKLQISNTDLLTLDWTTAADVDMQAQATTTAAVQSGIHWLRATLDVDNGASGYDAKFYYSASDTNDPNAVSWTQIGSTITGGAVTNIIDARSSLLEIGAVNSGTQSFWAFDCYRGIVRDGIGGTIIADFDAHDWDVGDSDTDTAVDTTGKTWTIFGGSSVIETSAGNGVRYLLDDASIDSIYQIDALPVTEITDSAVVTKTHTTDAVVLKTSTRTHTTDALIKKTSTRTHTTDALIRKTSTKTHTTDALIKKLGTRTHTTDAVLKSLFSASTKSSAWTTTPDPQTVSHDPLGPVDWMLGVVFQTVGATDDIDGVPDYGGVDTPRVASIPAFNVGEEPGRVYVFFTDSPPTGTQTWTIPHTATSNTKVAWVITGTGAAPAITAINASTAEIPLTGSMSHRLITANPAQRYVFTFSGANSVASFVPLSGMSTIDNHDFGNQIVSVDRETHVSTDFTIGYTTISDDFAGIAVAVEPGAVAPVPTLYRYLFNSSTTAHLCGLMPTEDGDRLLASAAFSNNGGTIATPSGWSRLDAGDGGSSTMISGLFVRECDGTEVDVDFVTGSATNSTGGVHIWHIPAALIDQETPPEITAVGPTASGTPDPGSLTPSWGSAANHWFLFLRRDAADGITSIGSNYDLHFQYDPFTGAEAASSYRVNTATSEDPPSSSVATTDEEFEAYTVANRPPVVRVTHTTDALVFKTQTKTHTADALIKRTQLKTHTADAYIVLRLNRTHTTDAWLKKLNNLKTQTTDALILKRQTTDHTTDGLIEKVGLLTQSVDALIKAFGTLRTHTTDAIVVLRILKTHTTDALIRRTQVRDHTTDALLVNRILKVHTTDALLRKLQVRTHTTDALLKALGTLRTHTSDALIVQSFTQTHTSDALLRKLTTKTHTTDALLLKLQVKVHTTDALIVLRLDEIHTTDAVLRKTAQTSHTTDAILVNRILVFHTTDAGLKRLLTQSHTTNVHLKKTQGTSHTTDVLITDATSIHHSTDALLRKTQNRTHTTDSLVVSRVQKTHSTGVVLRKLQGLTHTADALVERLSVDTHTTDAWIKRTQGKVHTTDALIRDTTAIVHTNDALLVLRVTSTHTTEALVRKTSVRTHTADAVLEKDQARSHLTNALLRKAQNRTHTTDALIPLHVVVVHTNDALILARKLKVHSADAIIERDQVAAHTTDAFLRFGATKAHQTDAFLFGRAVANHTTNAWILKTGITVSHGADAYIGEGRSIPIRTNKPLLDIKTNNPDQRTKSSESGMEVKSSRRSMTISSEET